MTNKVWHTANGEIEIKDGRVYVSSTFSETVSESVPKLLKNNGLIQQGNMTHRLPSRIVDWVRENN